MSANPGLHRFHGGLHLPDHKQESLTRPLEHAGIPDKIILRVNQHIGEENEPQVKVGQRVLKRQVLARSSEFVSAPVHAPTSGIIRAIEKRPVAHASRMSADCFVIEPDGIEEGLEPPSPIGSAHRIEKKDAMLQRIREFGIVGLGGAAFPTAAKIETADRYNIKTLIINGAECEPYITCDDILMRSDPLKVLRGIASLQLILQPRETLIGIEDNKQAAIAAMQGALDKLGLDNTRIVVIPTLYPSGGEKQLIRILTGIEVRSGQLSFEVGVFCQNVGTCAAIARAIEENEPLTSRIVTVTGPGVRNPSNWTAKLGTPVSWLIEKAGGYRVDEPMLVMGGPMMGLELESDQIPVVKATNTILVLDKRDQPIVRECVRCGQCTEACPAQLLPQQLYWYSRSRQFDHAEQYHLFDCIECGCCAAVCPSHLPLVQYYRFAKGEIWEQRRKTWKSDQSRRRHEFREARIQKQKALEEERRRQKREELARKKAAERGGEAEAKPAAASQDLVKAALERVKARKKSADEAPRNTTDLTPEQQRQIDEADERRRQMNKDKQ
jgi:electron transport complex protein RnfC